MVKSKLPRVVLDSNILVSAYVFGGKPEIIVKMIAGEHLEAVTSPALINEFVDTLGKKFGVSEPERLQIQDEIQEAFEVVYPTEAIYAVRDPEDNKVLEAAFAGKCDYIVTGDKDLLALAGYKGIKILTASEFLQLFEKN